MKILALDVGDVWIGSAISDVLGIMANPLETIKYDDSVDFICKLAMEEGVSQIVVGLPKTLAGEESEQTKKTRDYVKKISTSVAEKIGRDLEWIWWDERKSSQQAQQLMRHKRANTHKKRAQKKNREHSVAAAIILQGFLDRRAFLGST